jgi:hypothetical protein
VRGFAGSNTPSLGFSKDLAKRLNPRKSFLPLKGEINAALTARNQSATPGILPGFF